MRGPWRRTRARAVLAAGLAAVLLAGCADFLAPPAQGARLSLSLQPGPPARQTSADSVFDTVDGLAVAVYRGETVVMADSFAVFPVGGVIRQSILVAVAGVQETLHLFVELHAGGEPVLAGDTVLRLVRGERTTVEVELVPVFPASGSAAGAGVAPSRGLPSTRVATRRPDTGHPLRLRAGALP